MAVSGERSQGATSRGAGACASGFGDRGDVAVQADDRVLLVDQHLDARRDRQPAAGRAVAGDPAPRTASRCTARPTRPRPVPGIWRRRSRSGRGRPAPSAAATRRSIRSPVSPANSRVHGLERGAFHLAKLDGQDLEQVAVGVDRRGAAALRRADQPPGHVEPDGPLARPGPGRGVDRDHARGVEDAGGQRGRDRAGPRARARGTPEGSRADRPGQRRHAGGHPCPCARSPLGRRRTASSAAATTGAQRLRA